MDFDTLLDELEFKMARASGAGGQHVNKVATKVILYFNLFDSKGLDDHQKALLEERLESRLTKAGKLQLQCGATRSQLKNKEIVIQRFKTLITENLATDPPRKPTRIPKAVVKKRLENKKKQAQKKANRKPPEL